MYTGEYFNIIDRCRDKPIIKYWMKNVYLSDCYFISLRGMELVLSFHNYQVANNIAIKLLNRNSDDNARNVIGYYIKYTLFEDIDIIYEYISKILENSMYSITFSTLENHRLKLKEIVKRYADSVDNKTHYSIRN